MNILLTILICLFKSLLINVSANDTFIESYSNDVIQEYLTKMAYANVSTKCSDSLLKVKPFLNAYDTIAEQKRLFYASYSSGDVKYIRSRDQDRWHFRFRTCITSSAEGTATPSEHPLVFCVGRYKLKQIGICIPTTCYDDHSYLLNEWKRIDDNNRKSSIDNDTIALTHCTRSRHPKEWFQSFSVVFETSVGFGIILTAGLATAYHLVRGDKHIESVWMKIFVAFSVKKTFETITKVSDNPSSTIKCICGLRVIATLWVLLGHSCVFIMDFIENGDDLKEHIATSYAYQPMTNAAISVEMFFVIGAVLCSYHWFRSIAKPGAYVPTLKSWKYWLGFYRHRVLRLWPAYAYILILSTMRFPFMRYHENYPVWGPDDYGVMCSKHWWENLLFINSFTDGYCLPWTWYISTEFVFFFVSPLYLLALKYRPRLGVVVSSLTIITSTTALTLQTIRYNFPPTQTLYLTPHNYNEHTEMYQKFIYVKPQYRISSYLIGLLTGYILALCSMETKRDDQKQTIKESKSLQLFGWILCMLALLWSTYGMAPCFQNGYSQFYRVIYTAFHRIVFSLAICWTIYACHKGFGGFLNTFLSSKFFVPHSALCYTFYLIHLFPIFNILMSASFPIKYDGFTTVLSYYWKIVLLCYSVSMLIMFMIEMPALHIVRIFFGNVKPELKHETIRHEKNGIKKIESFSKHRSANCYALVPEMESLTAVRRNEQANNNDE